MKRPLALCVIGLVGFVVFLEVAIRFASFFAPDRGGVWDPGVKVRILCVGDSHTWGTSVERSESYPGRLQTILDERAPGDYGVMNLGVPGMNTSQLRNRLPEWIARHDPDIVILWVGVNNEWNVAEVDDSELSLVDRIDQLALTSRLYRWFKVWKHARGLERYEPQGSEDRVWSHESEGDLEQRTRRVKHDGVIEIIEHERREVDLSRVEKLAVLDFKAISAYAKSNGLRLIFVTYPLNMKSFLTSNLAMWRVAEEEGHALVESWEALARVAPDRREWLWGLHPGAAIYDEIARDVAERVMNPDSFMELPFTSEELRHAVEVRDSLIFALMKGVAAASEPINAAELDHIRSQAETMALSFDVDSLAAMDAGAFATEMDRWKGAPWYQEIVVTPLREGLIPALNQTAEADGDVSAAERERVEEVREVLFP